MKFWAPTLGIRTRCSQVKEMKTDELRAKLYGAIAFPVTPFNSDLSLDVLGLRRNLQVLLQQPIAAVVAAGGTGEMYSLTPAEHLAVTRATVEEVNGRVPVIGSTGFNYPLAVQLAQQSERAGADAMLALPPYYPSADDQGLAEYYAAIGSATSLPLLVYSRDWVNPSPMPRIGNTPYLEVLPPGSIPWALITGTAIGPVRNWMSSLAAAGALELALTPATNGT